MDAAEVILVDSDVLIHHLRGREAAHRWLREARTATGTLSVSALGVVEVAGGKRSGDRRAVSGLFATLRICPVTEEIARHAAELQRRFRRSHAAIGLADYVVAATAQVEELDLATMNVKHFPMFRGLRPPFSLPAASA